MKKIRRLKDNSFSGYIRRTWKNKVLATILLITGFASTFDGDATWLVFTIFVWIGLFFSKYDYFR